MTVPIVTSNAIIRYLERKNGVDIRPLWIESGADCPSALVQWMRKSGRVPVADIVREITRQVKPFIELGAVYVPSDGIRFVLSGPCVKTVLNAEWEYRIDKKRSKQFKRRPADFREMAL